MKEFIKKLKSFSGLVGSVLVLIPGISFFFKYTPPLFDGIWILVSALSAAFIWFGFNSKYQQPKNISSIKFILTGFFLAIFYLVILDNTSIVVHSDGNTVRYQVGWNISPWSLEQTAIEKIKNHVCRSVTTKENLLFCYSVARENTFLIWKSWSIYLFGILNIVTFTASCLFWSYGWGKIIKTDH